MCQPLLTMKTTVIPCDPKIRYNQHINYGYFFSRHNFLITPNGRTT